MTTRNALTTITAPAHLAAVALSFDPASAYIVADVLDGLASHARRERDGGLWRAHTIAGAGDMSQLVDIVDELVCNIADRRALAGLATYLDGLATTVIAESFMH